LIQVNEDSPINCYHYIINCKERLKKNGKKN
jgi:hypothetical protein